MLIRSTVIQSYSNLTKMDFISHETECKMFAYLREIGCCTSCCLRFVGTRSLETFREPPDSAVKLKYVAEGENIVDDDASPCTACLGILQEVTQKSAVEKMISAIEEGAYDDGNFNCALTLPVCLALRERSVQTALTVHFQLSDTQQTSLRLRTQNVKEIWKSKVLGRVEQAVGKQLLAAPNPSPLLVEISFIYKNDVSEIGSLPNGKKNQSPKYSRKTMESALLGMTNEAFQECYKSPPARPQSFVVVEKVTCVHASIFIGGRYAKFSRELSQTPWFINGEKKMETSVQDLICGSMIKLTKADSVKFLSSGREDVDVRSIYSGRPFAVELVNPKNTLISSEQLDSIVTEINDETDLVKITAKLKILTPLDLKKLKEGENEKTKVYRALCTLKNTSRDLVKLDKLRNMKNVEIVQKTPMRVLHRRPLISRIRLIHAMRSRWLRDEELAKIREHAAKSGASDTSHIDDLFVLDVKTQAGTYVKEFVHGDFGRTRPSLCDILGADFDIVALDVTAINLEWP